MSQSDRKYIRPLSSSKKKALYQTKFNVSPKQLFNTQAVLEEGDVDEYIIEAANKIQYRLRQLHQYFIMMLEIQSEGSQDIINNFHLLQTNYQQLLEQNKTFNQDIQQLLLEGDREMETVIKQNEAALAQDINILDQEIRQFEYVKDLLYQQQELKNTYQACQEDINLQEGVLQQNAFQLKQSQLKILQLQESNKIKEDKILELQQNSRQIFHQQRSLNNELQEAKGNIRVYCRIRSLLQHETEINIPSVSTNGDCTIILTVPKNYHKSDNFQKSYTFNFEHIFDITASQNQVYTELSQLIENVIDGHNVCIFAYGQTGSGKTYTMQGLQRYEERGVIPRAVEQIFVEIKNFEGLGWQFTVSVSFQEIYNETVRDLLNNQKTDEVQLTVVENQPRVSELFEKAMNNRSVAETQCNEFSSRSHFIFQMNVQGHNISSQEKNTKNQSINATLNLIDLAGSERLNLSKTEGDRLKETQNINKSLTALSDVINALATRAAFVPYRNSKLTHVLQKYLEGSSKTLMLVNVCPRTEDFNQTLQSLRFAEKVKDCKAGNQTQVQTQPLKAKN